MFQVDFREVFIRLVKYLVEGIAVALAAYYIPKKNTNSTEIFMIAITAAATFAILDMAAPAVSVGARFGAGFSTGSGNATGL
jgi:ABC-type Co2+ transport system permease subunit